MASVPVSIAAAAAALAAALAAVGARLSAPPVQPTGCVQAVSAFYANERTSGRPGSVDTVLYVPTKGPLLDSLAKADSAPNGAIMPQPADSFIAKPIQICRMGDSTTFKAVLGT